MIIFWVMFVLLGWMLLSFVMGFGTAIFIMSRAVTECIISKQTVCEGPEAEEEESVNARVD